MSTMVLSPQAVPHVRRPAPTTPARSRAHGVRRGISACTVRRPVRTDWVLRVKVAAVAVLGVLGMGASVAEFASWAEVDPAVEVVQGDPAWAHVTGR